MKGICNNVISPACITALSKAFFGKFRLLSVIVPFLFISLISNKVFACDQSSFSYTSVDNGNGTYTYTITLNVDFGGSDLPYYGLALVFNSTSGTPTITSFSPATMLAGGGLSDNLTGLRGNNINSVANDPCFDAYDGLPNTLTYEYGGVGSAAFVDFTRTITVTVNSCVSSIDFIAHANTYYAINACNYNVVNTNSATNCPPPPPCDCSANISCGGQHYDCSADAASDYADALSGVAPIQYTFAPAITTAGENRQVCFTYTTGPTETSVGFSSVVQVSGAGSCFGRTYQVYQLGNCGSTVASSGALPVASFSSGNYYTVLPNTQYRFCVTLTNTSCTSIIGTSIFVFNNSNSGGCGTCASPCTSSGMGAVSSYPNRTYLSCYQPQCPIYGPTSFTNCFTATSDATGFLGFINARVHDGSTSCISTSWTLKLASNCAGPTIVNPITNAHSTTSGFNPEYSGLLPNTQYVLCVTYTLSNLSCGFDGIADQICIDSYGSGCVPPSASISPATTSICQGATLALTASGGGTYAWGSTGGGTITGSTSGATVTVTSAGTYTVTVTASAGCTSTAQRIITLNNVTASISGTTSICSGGNTTLTASGGGTYVWAGSGGGTISGSTSGSSITATSAGTYNVTVTNNGCTSVSNVSVTANSATASISGTTSICSGGNTTLTASGGGTYVWAGSGGGTISGSTSGSSITATSAGTYNVTVTNNGCTSVSNVSVTANSATASISGTTSICSGGNTTLTASGGGTYIWAGSGGGTISGSTSGSSITATSAGTYNVTVTNNGCTSVSNVSVTANSATASISGTTSICSGGNTTLTASGGGTYVWAGSGGGTISGSTSGSSITATSAGTYNVTVTNNGCTSVSNVSVTANSATASISGTTSICSGGNTTLTASGGGTYVWAGSGGGTISGSTSGSSITATSAGTYNVTVTNNGCTSVSNVSVTANSATASISGTTSICSGGNTTLTASGGGTYVWAGSGGGTISGSTSGSSITATSAGTYNVTVTNNGCTSVSNVSVTANSATASITGNLSICAGANTSLTASGGSSYQWAASNGGAIIGSSSTNIINTTTAGLYTVTVTNNGCTSVSSVTVVSSSSLNPLISGASPICSGSSAVLNVGSGYSTIIWDGPGVTSLTTQTVTASSQGLYSVTVSNASGCTGTAQVMLNVNANPSASITGNLTFCQGQNTTLVASGGTSYLWSNGNTSNNLSVTTANSYSVTVTNNGCTSVSSVTVTSNSATASISGTTSICSGSNTTLTASGGGTYVWAGSGGGTISGSTSGSSITATSAGTYNVTVTNNGCTSVSNVSVTANSATASISGTTSICSGSNTTLTAAGGGTYIWVGSGGGTISGSTSGANITATSAGTYTVTVTNNGCTSVSNVSVTANSATASITGNLSICAGANTSLTASGGSSYQWAASNGGAIIGSSSTNIINTSTAGLYTVTVTNNGCTSVSSVTVFSASSLNPQISGASSICSGSSTVLNVGSGYSNIIWNGPGVTNLTTQTVTASSQGLYSVTVSNASGCTGTAQATLSVNAIPSASITGNTTFCQGQNSTLVASGGIDYLWSNGNTSNTITVNSTGTYTVTVTNNGCTSVSSTNINVNPLPVVSISGNTQICSGENTTLLATGGGSYLWSDATTLNSLSVNSGGNYTVTVTNNGCSSTAIAQVIETSLPTVTIAGSTTICQGNATTLTANGATSYSWTATSGGTIMGASNQTSIQATTAGVYTVVASNNGCTSSAAIVVTQANSLSPQISGPNAICSGQTATLDAGTGFQNYIWSNNTMSSSITVSTANTYAVTVTDASGCSGTAQVVLAVNQVPTAAIAGSAMICQGQNTNLTASGGSNYIWSTNDATPSIVVNQSNTYTVTVTDNGCTSVSSINVNVVPLPIANIIGDDILCFGETSILTASGGGSYSWDANGQSQSGSTVSASSAGLYSVTVTNNGCTSTSALPVTSVAQVLPQISGSTSICLGSATTLDAGAGYQSYLWSNAGTTQQISTNTPGNYAVTVTTTEGACTGVANVDVILSNSLSLSITGEPSFCTGTSTTLNAGSGFFTYSWMPGGNTSPSITVSSAQIYTVTVSNQAGCTGTASITVVENLTPPASISGITTFCQGTNTTLTAAGGSSYLWADGATTPDITVNSAGVYIVTVTSNQGCSAITQVQVNESSGLSPFITAPNSICEGSTATLDAGSGYNTYHWSLGNQSTQSISTTTSGTYTVTVTDAGGCTGVSTVSLIVNNLPNPQISGNTSICSGSSTTLNAGSGFDSYIWSVANQTNATISVNSAGTYTVTVTDNGCSSTASASVTVNQAVNNTINLTTCNQSEVGTVTETYTAANGCDSIVTIITSLSGVAITTDISTSDYNGFGVSCFGENDGTISLSNTQGGAGGFTYLWSNSSTSSSLSNVPAGTYYVTISDVNACSRRDTIVLLSPDQIAGTASAQDESCVGAADGSITLTNFEGGALPYTIDIDGQSSNIGTTSNLSPNTYEISLVDANGCKWLDTLIIAAGEQVSVQTINDIEINKGTTIPLTSTITTTADYTLLWTPASNLSCSTCENPIFTGDSDAMYTILVTTENGCTAQDQVNIRVKEKGEVFVPNAFSPNDDGDNDKLTVYASSDANIEKINSFRVFDRWGNMVYQTYYLQVNSQENGWDGTFNNKPMNPEVFVYTAEIQYKDGTITIISGDVTLIKQ
ncbi:MAG: gliding motility-associated C-terminal domain-containing protein [Saprospiraceae bacterium]|nr:gliding motility-associated C-terminal domain-containing protein [Saprospiraceae bacterium]